MTSNQSNVRGARGVRGGRRVGQVHRRWVRVASVIVAYVKLWIDLEPMHVDACANLDLLSSGPKSGGA